MKKFLVLLAAFVFPVFAFAQFTDISSSLGSISGFINQLIPIGIGIGVLVFIFGLIKYVTAGADEDGRKGARDTIIWGIVVIFAMTAVWGLVGFLADTTGLNSTTQAPAAPQIPTQ